VVKHGTKVKRNQAAMVKQPFCGGRRP
jgi:hypothetical protein